MDCKISSRSFRESDIATDGADEIEQSMELACRDAIFVPIVCIAQKLFIILQFGRQWFDCS